MSRRGHGSTKIPNHKPRPAPAQEFSAVINNALQLGGEDEEEDFSLREELKGECQPLEGFVVCVTGIKEERSELQGIALGLGARVQQALTADVTHLVALHTTTPKYKCAIEYGIQVMKPAWLYDMREAWLQGDAPGVSALSQTHRLRPFHDLYISLTGFSSDPALRKDLTAAIAGAGGTYKPTFVKSCTHLIVGPEFKDHEMALNSPKVVKAQEFAALHQSSPNEQKHAVQVVWSEWLDDSLNLCGALDEAKYSILKPRSLQDRVTAMKSLVNDEPVAPSKAQEKRKSPVLRKESTALVEDSKVNPLDLSSSKPVRQALFSQAAATTAPRKRSSDGPLSGSLRKKHKPLNRAAPSASQGVHGLLDLTVDDGDEDTEMGPTKPFSGPSTNRGLATSKTLKPERSLSQLAPPRPPTASSSGSQLSRLTSKSTVRSGSLVSKSQPFPSGSACQRPSKEHAAQTLNTSSATLSSQRPTKRPSESTTHSEAAQGDNGFLEGLRFALCELEPKHVEKAQAAIHQCGGRVVRSASTLDKALSEDVDYVMTKLLHDSHTEIDLSHPSLIAQSWLEKCLSIEGFVDPDSFWAGRPVRVDGAQSYRTLKVSLPDGLLDEYDRFALERICRQLDISYRSDLAPGWTSHAVVTNLADAASLVEEKSDMCLVSISQFLELLQESSSAAGPNKSSSPAHQGILHDCVISISKKMSSLPERKRALDLISALGAQHASGASSELTHLIHIGDMRAPDVKAAQSRAVRIVHLLWLDQCLKTSDRALERAFPPTFQPGSALTFGSLPPPSAPAKMQRSKTTDTPTKTSLIDDSISTVVNSMDDLPPPVDLSASNRKAGLAKRSLSSHSQFTKSKSQPNIIPHTEKTSSVIGTDGSKESDPHPADVSFEPIVPVHLLNGSSKAHEVKRDGTPAARGPGEMTAPEQSPTNPGISSSHLLNGLKSLFDVCTHPEAGKAPGSSGVDSARSRKQRRQVLTHRPSSPSLAADRSDDSDAFAPSDYIQPRRQSGIASSSTSGAQKRARSAFEMTQLQGASNGSQPMEETQGEDQQSMRITVVDPAAREAKMRLLGQSVIPTLPETDPSSGDDFMTIPGPSTRRSGRVRSYREERV